jgi:hypothetical protein
VNPVAIFARILGSRSRRGGRFALYFTVATTGFRLARRVMSTRQKTLLRFEVKPGEVYEIRGVRRGR